MALTALQEMLQLDEKFGSGLVDAFNSGKNAAKSEMGRRQAKNDRAADKADRATKKAARDIADNIATANKNAEDDFKKAQVEKKQLTSQELADDINQYLDDFFTKFPHYDASNSATALLDRYPSPESHQEIIDAYKALATRVEKLRQGFNKSLVDAGKVKLANIRKYDQQAKQMMGANPPAPPAPLVRFVKAESVFFKRLIRVKANAELNDTDFRNLLALKIKQTDTGRVGDAAQALNILFGYLVSDFNKHAGEVSNAQADAADQERRDRMAQRTQPDPAQPDPAQPDPATP